MTTYRDGMDEGLRMALDIIRGLEGGVNERLEQGSASIRTRDTRKTRAQAYRNAAARIETRLRARRANHPGERVIQEGLSRLGL